jgi:hypothetical protein
MIIFSQHLSLAITIEVVMPATTIVVMLVDPIMVVMVNLMVASMVPVPAMVAPILTMVASMLAIPQVAIELATLWWVENPLGWRSLDRHLIITLA